MCIIVPNCYEGGQLYWLPIGHLHSKDLRAGIRRNLGGQIRPQGTVAVHQHACTSPATQQAIGNIYIYIYWVYTYIHLSIYLRVYIHNHIYIYIHMYVYICMWYRMCPRRYMPGSCCRGMCSSGDDNWTCMRYLGCFIVLRIYNSSCMIVLTEKCTGVTQLSWFVGEYY